MGDSGCFRVPVWYPACSRVGLPVSAAKDSGSMQSSTNLRKISKWRANLLFEREKRHLNSLSMYLYCFTFHRYPTLTPQSVYS